MPGLGLIGALVWYWQQAEDGGEHVVAVLKAFALACVACVRGFQGARPPDDGRRERGPVRIPGPRMCSYGWAPSVPTAPLAGLSPRDGRHIGE